MRLTVDPRRPAFFVTLLFLVTAPYNGPGHSLHLLSVAWLLLFVWLSTIVIRTDLRNVELASGWLPALAALYLGWLVVAPFASSFSYISAVQAASLMFAPVVFLAWLVASAANRGNEWETTFRLLLGCGLALALWGAIDFFYWRERAHGPLIDPNAYAALINLFLVPVVWNFLYQTRERRIATLGAPLVVTALLAFALFASLSRGGLLAFIAVLIPLLWLTRQRHDVRFRLVLLVAVMASAYLVVRLGPVDNEGLQGLLLDAHHKIRDRSAQERLLLWKATWGMIADANVVIGRGLGTFRTFYPAYRIDGEHSLGNYAHNDYLQAMAEGGAVQLAFLLAFTIAAPIVLLRDALRKQPAGMAENPSLRDSPGLLLAVLCISMHALVNFIHFIAPIALLTGLYLAVCWSALRRKRRLCVVPAWLSQVRAGMLKLPLIALLTIQTAVIGLDGLIFKWFGSGAPAFANLNDRFAVLNAMIALRPANPTPRVTLILHLLEGAQASGRPERDSLLELADKETRALSEQTPHYALVPLFLGQIAALRGTRADLLAARAHFEEAVRRAPHSTSMRADLIEIHRRLGEDQAAYRVLSEARAWLGNETSVSSLVRFARMAKKLAEDLGKPDEARYWESIASQAASLLVRTDNPSG